MSEDGEVLSDVDPEEEPYYPETERVLIGHSRYGRPIYSAKRLIVTLPFEEEDNAPVEDTSEEDEDHEEDEEDEESDGDSFVSDDEDVDPNADFEPGNGI